MKDGKNCPTCGESISTHKLAERIEIDSESGRKIKRVGLADCAPMFVVNPAPLRPVMSERADPLSAHQDAFDNAVRTGWPGPPREPAVRRRQDRALRRGGGGADRCADQDREEAMTPVKFVDPSSGCKVAVIAEHIEIIEPDLEKSYRCILTMMSGRSIAVEGTVESVIQNIRTARNFSGL